VRLQVSGGLAEVAACAAARFAHASADYATKLVAAQGLANLVKLLAGGCTSAQVQAAKALLVLAQKEEYTVLMVHLGAIAEVQRTQVRPLLVQARVLLKAVSLS
jgi:hypothetical protein